MSPDKPDTATIIANWIPGEDPAAGPNYYTFSTVGQVRHLRRQERRRQAGHHLLLPVHEPAVQFFLGNTQQQLHRDEGGRRQVRRWSRRGSDPAGQHRPALDAELPQRSRPQGVHSLADGSTVFAGQRDDAFFADVGAIFDLVAIRNGTGATGGGKDFLSGYDVHSIALQIPISQLDNDGSHTVGVWAATDRQKVTVRNGKPSASWVQVSRLGNPLINEVIIPTDAEGSLEPHARRPRTSSSRSTTRTPILADRAAASCTRSSGRSRTPAASDLVAVLLTGLKTPALNYTGPTLADELRLNLSIPATPFDKANRLGVLGGDLAGLSRTAAGSRTT